MKEMFIRFFYCKNTNNLLNFRLSSKKVWL